MILNCLVLVHILAVHRGTQCIVAPLAVLYCAYPLCMMPSFSVSVCLSGNESWGGGGGGSGIGTLPQVMQCFLCQCDP